MSDLAAATAILGLSMTRISILRLKPKPAATLISASTVTINDKNLNSEIET